MTIAITAVLLVLVGLALNRFTARARVPNAITFMLLGVIVGPHVANLLPAEYLEIGTTVTKSAFVVVLMRAGMSIPPRRVLTLAPFAIAFGLAPVLAEVAVVSAFCRAWVFDSWRVSLLGAALVAAISPAVVIPTMQAQKDAGLGSDTALPDRIMGLTLVNLIFAQSAILVMIDITRYWAPSSEAMFHVYWFPMSILGGIAMGLAIGAVLPVQLFLGRQPDAAPSSGARIGAVGLIVGTGLAVYFAASHFALESVFATLAAALYLRHRADWWEPVLRREFLRAWSIAEVLLFATLGAQIDIAQLANGWIVPGLCGIVVFGLGARVAVSQLMSVRTALPRGQRLHVVFAQVPKATVQAVFGAVPLAIFRAENRESLYRDGEVLLIMSVIAIVLTAPIGALLLERNGERLLAEQERGVR